MTVNSLELACRTHLALARQNNEDSFTADGDYGLFVVADGMGSLDAVRVDPCLGLSHCDRPFVQSFHAACGR